MLVVHVALCWTGSWRWLLLLKSLLSLFIVRSDRGIILQNLVYILIILLQSFHKFTCSCSQITTWNCYIQMFINFLQLFLTWVKITFIVNYLIFDLLMNNIRLLLQGINLLFQLIQVMWQLGENILNRCMGLWVI